MLSRIVCDDFHHLCNEVLHVIGPLLSPSNDLLMVGVNAGVVLNYAHVGDKATSEYLHPTVMSYNGFRDCTHSNSIYPWNKTNKI